MHEEDPRPNYIPTAEAMNSQIAPPPAAEGRVDQGFPNSQALPAKPQKEDPTPTPEAQDTDKAHGWHYPVRYRFGFALLWQFEVPTP